MSAVNKALLTAAMAVLLGTGPVQAQTGQQGAVGPGMGHMMGQGMMGPGMMGPGMMGQGMGPGMGYGMGPGGMMGQMPCMMGQGMGACMLGPGMMGPGMMGMMGQGGMPGCPGGGMWGAPMMGQPSNLNLSVADVKANLERWLSWHGNARLKVGNVTEKDGMITADIVTVDNSLVHRLNVDPRSGATRGVP